MSAQALANAPNNLLLQRSRRDLIYTVFAIKGFAKKRGATFAETL
jgi:hypothetical protein